MLKPVAIVYSHLGLRGMSPEVLPLAAAEYEAMLKRISVGSVLLCRVERFG